MINASLKLTPYARRYRRDLMRLIDEHYRLHLHLDWETIDQWIDDPDTPIYLAWNDRTLIGSIAASTPLHGASWLRLAVIDDDVDAAEVLSELWAAVRTKLLILGTHQVGALLIRPWLTQHLGLLGFSYGEQIVTLRRQSSDLPSPHHSDLHVRNVGWRETETIAVVDHAAFAPMWQLGVPALRQAIRMAAHVTVVEIGDRIVGYQLTTHHHDGAHLARLAVLPELQGSGIGGVLVANLINWSLSRGIMGISVNTQQSNEQSQRLYRRYGFALTGLDMPFWSHTLAENQIKD